MPCLIGYDPRIRDVVRAPSDTAARQMRAMPVFYITLDCPKDRRARSEDLWRNRFRMQRVAAALSHLRDLNPLLLTAPLKHFRRTDVDGVVRLKRKGTKASPGVVLRREDLPRLRRLHEKARRENVPHDKLARYGQGRHHSYPLWPHLMHQANDFSDIEQGRISDDYLDDDGQRRRLDQGGSRANPSRLGHRAHTQM
jgi:hypothetical protein